MQVGSNPKPSSSSIMSITEARAFTPRKVRSLRLPSNVAFTQSLSDYTSKFEKIGWAERSGVGGQRAKRSGVGGSTRSHWKSVRKRHGSQQSPSIMAATLVAPGEEMGFPGPALSSLSMRPPVLDELTKTGVAVQGLSSES